MDRSIKPGDVIETEGNLRRDHPAALRANVSIVTRENTEYLIPNEDLITQRVINWSFSSDLIRLSVPIGISYDSDVRLAMRPVPSRRRRWSSAWSPSPSRAA